MMFQGLCRLVLNNLTLLLLYAWQSKKLESDDKVFNAYESVFKISGLALHQFKFMTYSIFSIGLFH